MLTQLRTLYKCLACHATFAFSRAVKGTIGSNLRAGNRNRGLAARASHTPRVLSFVLGPRNTYTWDSWQAGDRRYEQPLTGVEHSRWDIGHRGIVSYLSFGRVTSNSPGGPGGLVLGFIRTRSRFDDDRRLLTLIKRSAWKRSGLKGDPAISGGDPVSVLPPLASLHCNPIIADQEEVVITLTRLDPNEISFLTSSRNSECPEKAARGASCRVRPPRLFGVSSAQVAAFGILSGILAMPFPRAAGEASTPSRRVDWIERGEGCEFELIRAIHLRSEPRGGDAFSILETQHSSVTTERLEFDRFSFGNL
ncbi:hypothetical protein ALC62_12121 [Cyphomyrmex costatus]|uniref:Uncharacterized protein n=1 Tax=Cyphomyrmex costatus TaxID=456900 RepID=A0A151IBS4_9HYME|nr:hypothetical protein ALC62_12121 [Cyphomyrmex costatus]